MSSRGVERGSTTGNDGGGDGADAQVSMINSAALRGSVRGSEGGGGAGVVEFGVRMEGSWCSATVNAKNLDVSCICLHKRAPRHCKRASCKSLMSLQRRRQCVCTYCHIISSIRAQVHVYSCVRMHVCVHILVGQHEVILRG